MNEEELEVKAKEYSVKKFDTVWNIAVKVYKAGYRACTKEIKQLGERCNQLLKDKGELIDRCRELEAQIEKMKADVKQGQSYWSSCAMQYDLYQRLLDKWEMKEK